ncbi:hypothetical protein [Gordonia alkanivorans]|uniref:hypothetical protein n=1 Tax=Gordonia alkanivorans TaxID=84096 RepID=UPI0005A822CB|nr:hypothetical protein [Gordonia alkanivorans]
MEPLNYDLPEWGLDEDYLPDCTLNTPSLGTFLGLLCDVALITHAVGGTLMRRGPEFADLTYPHLQALIRYVPVRMALMGNYTSDQLDAMGVAPGAIVLHSLWLLEVEHAALTLAYNIEVNPDNIPAPGNYADAAQFGKSLVEYARHARDFYERITDSSD